MGLGVLHRGGSAAQQVTACNAAEQIVATFLAHVKEEVRACVRARACLGWLRGQVDFASSWL